MARRSPWPGAGIAGAVLLSLVGTSSPALGDVRSEARKHFSAGMEHISAGRYPQGVAELEQAYELLPHASVRYNIAKAWDDAGELEKAVAAYEDYLTSDPEDRVAVVARVAELQKELGRSRTAPAAPQPQPRPDLATPTAPVDPPAVRSDVYEERVVTASRSAQSPLDSPNSTTIVTAQDIHLSGITRIPELLRRVAGMDVMPITGGDTNVSMRGLNSRLSNKLLVLVNGRSVKNDILGSTFWEAQSIDVDQIERIEVVRGPGSSLYGADAFSGVVNIITKTPGQGAPGVRLGFGDQYQGYASGWASHRMGDFAYRASAGYTRYPRWTREVAPGRVDLHLSEADQDVGAQNVRIDLRSSYRVGRNQSLDVGGGFARSDLEIYGIGPFNDYYLRTNWGDVSGAYRSDWLEVRSNYTQLNAYASSNADYRGHTLYETDAVQHSFETDVELRHGVEAPTGLSHGLLGGVQYRLKGIDWSYLIDEPPIEHHAGVFVQDSLGFLEHYAVVLSGRVDYVPVLEGVVPSGRGTIIVKPGETKRQAIRASVATAFRTPTYLEAYLDLPIQLTLGGLDIQSQSERSEDPDFQLGPEHILAGELGYLNQQSDDFQVELAAYYHRVSDVIVLAEPRPLTLSNVAGGVGGLNHETGHYTVGFGGWTNRCSVDHVFGGEVGGRWYGVQGLDVFANYAINYGLLELPDGCAVPDDQKTSHHKVTVGTQLRASFGLEGEVTFHYQTKQLWGEQVATENSVETQHFELPAYHLLNGRIGYGFLEGRRANLSFVVFNALAGVFDEPPQMHPFGNRIGRRFMGFLSWRP